MTQYQVGGKGGRRFDNEQDAMAYANRLINEQNLFLNVEKMTAKTKSKVKGHGRELKPKLLAYGFVANVYEIGGKAYYADISSNSKKRKFIRAPSQDFRIKK